ncbi:2-(3-amino-3-carboxypropyl)histidine synthase subunit 1 [Oryza brachyantha]|uniref:2-(3-amino-3-carboxypropyl)histidine synthase subunit 1 n=1 Tax=Oryza brachyantha TaxID=4533 RepID=UPI001ADAA191|nr:2-(3-amino-3-carboxypropyl)histidine synthase subunit 1 [Oryza brachyantha]
MDAGEPSTSDSLVVAAEAAQGPKRKPPKRFVHTPIPPSILSDPTLVAAATDLLPAAYNFELPKTAHRIRSSGARRAALQLPEGLLLFSLPLSHLLAPFLEPDPSNDLLILADPTYGACCLADRPAKALAADVLVHYGHSCLVPVTSSLLPVLYVFVEIHVDAQRLADAVRAAFPDPADAPRMAIAGTVQFISAVHTAREILTRDGYHDIVVPQAKPLSSGEVLGCTAPALKRSEGIGAVVFVADGRFHLEAFMIANPGVKAYRFDPFLGVLVREEYDHVGMKQARKEAVLAARKAKSWGVILGTLGRQGSVKVLDRVVEHLEEKGLEHTVVLMSELSPARMELFGGSVDAWVQIACPRLSIDWGEGFTKPMLTTFEFDVALGYVPGWWEKGSNECGSGCCSGLGTSTDCGCSNGGCADKDFGGEYPMDYYSQDGGDWNSCYMKKKPSTGERKLRVRIGSNVQVEDKQ